MASSKELPKTRASSNPAAQALAVVLMVALVLAYIGLGVGLYPIMDERLGSWFTVICFVAMMAFALNLFVPAYSFIAGLWLYGSPEARRKAAAEQERQRKQLDVMTARSRQRWGGEGPPESRNGDLSPDASRHRDVGAGRARK